MNSCKQTFDVVVLTASRYVAPGQKNEYIENVLHEDTLVQEALQKRGLKVWRTSWDDPEFDWADTSYALFRTTWDYFDRFPEFSSWLDQVHLKTSLVNPYEMIKWNIDKHYLIDLENKGVPVPRTFFMEAGSEQPLSEVVAAAGWDHVILKPAVSGGARHTYKFLKKDCHRHEAVFRQLVENEAMMVQEFQFRVVSEGELALMLFDGKYSHAVLKKAKPGDFRVQDDFGGTVEEYVPSVEEKALAELTVSACDPLPVYARVDMIRDNAGRLCVSELELIEPELWFRKSPEAADLMAEAFINSII